MSANLFGIVLPHVSRTTERSSAFTVAPWQLAGGAPAIVLLNVRGFRGGGHDHRGGELDSDQPTYPGPFGTPSTARIAACEAARTSVWALAWAVATSCIVAEPLRPWCEWTCRSSAVMSCKNGIRACTPQQLGALILY